MLLVFGGQCFEKTLLKRHSPLALFFLLLKSMLFGRQRRLPRSHASVCGVRSEINVIDAVRQTLNHISSFVEMDGL